MIRVVVTGSECTGKTTLARALADHYRTAWVPEFAREFVERKGAPPEAGDVEAIARGQIRAEDLGRDRARDLLILDTDLISTLVYARHYYGPQPEWLEHEAAARRGDLYLLADLDVPWQADGAQRDRQENRDAMQSLFRKALARAAVPVVQVGGSRSERLERAVQAIDRRIAATRP